MGGVLRNKNSQYDVIALVIERMIFNAQNRNTESLEELSDALNMSPGYLQKVFTEWVGITPKQFERYLSIQYSKELLLQNKNMIETTIASGLSSTGRLHDLFVDIEAMTPGEYQVSASHLSIYYSTFETRFGICLVASTDRGICNVLFADSKEESLYDLKSRWPKAKLLEKQQSSHLQIKSYLNDPINSSNGKIKLHLKGTNFQIKVWEALLSIPTGSIATYGDVAGMLGDKKLSRAVGMAVGDNPIGYIIPCHRVLKSSGEISGYRWGVNRKRAMLGYEAAMHKHRDA